MPGWEQVAAEALTEAAERKATEAAKDRVDEWFADDKWHYLDSSNVMAFKYTQDDKILELEFKGGRQYRYYNVDQDSVHQLATASSPGKWWWANLQGAPAERI